MKKWYQSKTLWVNAIALIGSVAFATMGVTVEEWAGLSVSLLAAVNVVLRLITGDAIEGMEK